MSAMGRLRAMARASIAALVTVAPLALAAAAPAFASEPVTFGQPTASAVFQRGITFEQPIEAAVPIESAELLLTYPGSIGPQVIRVPVPSTGGATTLRHDETVGPGELTPNTTIEGRWRLTGPAGQEHLGPAVAVTYADDRLAWRSKRSGLVRFHWYEGGESFADRSLAIANDGLQQAEELFGVSETSPVDFFVYASRDAIYEALDPQRENVGGQAYPSIRTLFGLVTAADIDDPWVANVVRHEMAHLVFDTAVDNPYAYPPKWLNEGLAVYLAAGYSPADRATVERAARSGELLPLDAIAGQFPTSGERFGLAYAESVAAVDFLIRTHGQQAIERLVDAYADGLADDAAFARAIGQSPADVDRAWRAELGADDAAIHGPRPAEPGPLPADWGTTPAPGAPASAATASPVPQAPSGTGAGRTGADVAAIVMAAIVGIGIVGGLVVLRRRSRGAPA